MKTAVLTIVYRNGNRSDSVLPLSKAVAWSDLLSTDSRVADISVTVASRQTEKKDQP